MRVRKHFSFSEPLPAGRGGRGGSDRFLTPSSSDHPHTSRPHHGQPGISLASFGEFFQQSFTKRLLPPEQLPLRLRALFRDKPLPARERPERRIRHRQSLFLKNTSGLRWRGQALNQRMRRSRGQFRRRWIFKELFDLKLRSFRRRRQFRIFIREQRIRGVRVRQKIISGMSHDLLSCAFFIHIFR